MKKFNVKRSMTKDVVFGGLTELTRNRLVWYTSSIDPRYSHLTDEGKVAIIDIIEKMFRELQAIEEQEIKESAKQQTLDSLKENK